MDIHSMVYMSLRPVLYFAKKNLDFFSHNMQTQFWNVSCQTNKEVLFLNAKNILSRWGCACLQLDPSLFPEAEYGPKGILFHKFKS